MVDNLNKNEARRQIEERIKKSKSKKRIHIDKNELEFLLFDIVKLDYSIGPIKKEKEAKFLVWSGEFLSRIDLSEVDFSNVVWDINYTNNYKKYYLDNGITEINLSNTNANIDFGKGFKDYSYLEISGCNFEGTDLSKSFNYENQMTQTDDYTIYINNCSFKETKLVLNFDKIIKTYSNDFSNNDFSSIKIDKQFIIDNPNNNFSNTKIDIIDAEENKEDLYEELYEKDNLKNCYFNGNIISSQKDVNEVNASLYLESKGNKNKQIKTYRKELEDELNKAKKRIHIDNSILESLLFETKELYNINTNEVIKAKFLVWSGPFLSKIDLSEIDFSNVVWGCYETSYYKEKVIENTNCKELEELNKKKRSHIDVYKLNNIHEINLSNTNAKIDFSKSFSFLTEGRTFLENCNFEGTDLSNNELNECYIADSNLSNTGIRISEEKWQDLSKGYDKYFYIQRTNLSNNNFKNSYSIGKEGFDEHIYKCNLDNTGLNISVDEDETVKDVVEDNSINGCLINGKTIEVHKRALELNELLKKREELEEELEETKEREKEIKKELRRLNSKMKDM